MPKKPTIHVDRSTENKIGWTDNPTMQRFLQGLAAAGCEDDEIADILGVRLNTLRTAICRVPELEESLVKGRDAATQAMVAQLYRAAMGGQIHQEIKEVLGPKGKETTITTKELPPNPTLMMFWLVNRDGVNWRHVRQLISESRKAPENGDAAEASKIARLAGSILEVHPNGCSEQYPVPHQAARETGTDDCISTDISGDLHTESAGDIQDDVLDVPTETGTERA